MRKPFALLLMALVASPVTAQSVRDGAEAWQRGEFVAATGIWKPLAAKGDPDAAFNLGQAYRLGKGVPLDLGQAQTWLDKAARNGHVDAQTTLGLLLFQNGNRVGAMRWLNAAADTGEPRAMLMVGTAYYNGDGVSSDPVKAYAYVSRAAAQGLPPAKSTLADLDQVMPIEQRRQGLALAQQMVGVKAAPRPEKQATTTKPEKIAQTAAPPPPKGATKPRIDAAKLPPPVAKTGLSGNWRVQLGAFAQRSSAQALFGKVQGILDGRQAYYVAAGKVIRLQAGPFESRSAAAAACARLAPTACFPVESR